MIYGLQLYTLIFLLHLMYYYYQCVKKVGAELGLTPIIIRDTELKDQGFGGIV